MAVFMQPIYTQTVGAGGAASVTFNNIPQGFTDLKIVISARMSTSGAAYVGFLPNNNTGSIYTYTYIGINATAGTVYTGRSINTPYGFFAYTTSGANTANAFSNIEFYIQNYNSGLLKTCILDSVSEDNATQGNASLSPNSFIMNSTEPITSIVVKDTVSGTNLLENSTITIYGISERYDTAIPLAPTIGTVTDQAGFASVAFTANDSAAGQTADRYVVTSTPSGSTTYGQTSPIVTPAVLGTSYTYQVAAVNNLGSSVSAASNAVTSDNSYSSIATVSAPSGAIGNFLFTNIPQNYKHLQLRFTCRVASGSAFDEAYLIFNNATSEMMAHQMYGDGANSFLAGNAYTTVMFTTRVIGTGSTASVFSAGVIDILDYSDTSKGTTARTISGWDANGSGQIYIGSGAWSNLSPVTSIVFRSNSNFAQYSHAALYGIA